MCAEQPVVHNKISVSNKEEGRANTGVVVRPLHVFHAKDVMTLTHEHACTHPIIHRHTTVKVDSPLLNRDVIFFSRQMCEY